MITEKEYIYIKKLYFKKEDTYIYLYINHI